MFRIIYSAIFVLLEIFVAISASEAVLVVFATILTVVWIFILYWSIQDYRRKRAVKQSYKSVDDEWRNRW